MISSSASKPVWLRQLHAHLNPPTIDFLRKMSTEEILNSLRPGTSEALQVKPDGTIMQGNHRIAVLRERGIDVDNLPYEHYR